MNVVWQCVEPAAPETQPTVVPWLQGQSSVPAAQAQVLYSSTPLWSALLAALLLSGGEAMSPLGWAGGLAIVIASLVAARPLYSSS